MQSPVARSESDGAGEHGRVRYAKPSEWAAQKDIIKRLYLDENKTLDEVRRVMTDEHQFYATPSMYKKRIRAWHFSKKLEEDDVLEVLQQKLERKAAGETSQNLVIRGRVVRNQRLRRFLERRPEVLARLQAHTESYGVPSEVPAVRSLSPESRDTEMTLSAVRDYVRECASGSNGAWMWTPGGYTSRRRGIVDLRGSRTDMLRAVDEFYLLQASIDDNRPPKEIFQLLNSTLNRLSDAIRTELPDFIFQMMEILQHQWSSHTELSQIFRRHVAELGVVHLGRNHPLSILWIQMLRDPDRSSATLSQNVLELFLQELLKSVGPQDHLTCVALDYVLRFLIYTQGPFVSWLRFHSWLMKYPGWDDPPKWSKAVQSRLEGTNAPTVEPRRQIGGAHSLAPAAMDYRGAIDPEDLHSGYLLPYLAGRIAVRNGDAERAEGWFLRAKAVARRTGLPHLTDYYPKAFTNLHVLYASTNQEEKLEALHDELAAFKSGLAVGVYLSTKLLPAGCPDCV